MYKRQYIHSPYNSIYVDYDYIVELLGLEYTASTGSEVYIDKIEHIDAVKTQFKKMYGDNVEIYDNLSLIHIFRNIFYR